MNAIEIKDAVKKLEEYLPRKMHPTGWYFSSEIIPDAEMFERGHWECMFNRIDDLENGKRLLFSSESFGCAGARTYLGFKNVTDGSGGFLAKKERFKQHEDLGKAFYRQIEVQNNKKPYLVWSSILDIPSDQTIEVLNLWVDALGLTALTTLANFDRETNDNVILQFASGCQSLWTIPYREQLEDEPKACVGCLDPAMRKYIADDVLGFSLPGARFLEMAENIEDSFLALGSWKSLCQ